MGLRQFNDNSTGWLVYGRIILQSSLGGVRRANDGDHLSLIQAAANKITKRS
jgi:hypothetical protein